MEQCTQHFLDLMVQEIRNYASLQQHLQSLPLLTSLDLRGCSKEFLSDSFLNPSTLKRALPFVSVNDVEKRKKKCMVESCEPRECKKNAFFTGEVEAEPEISLFRLLEGGYWAPLFSPCCV